MMNMIFFQCSVNGTKQKSTKTKYTIQRSTIRALNHARKTERHVRPCCPVKKATSDSNGSYTFVEPL